jgi:hypothetical protein
MQATPPITNWAKGVGNITMALRVIFISQVSDHDFLGAMSDMTWRAISHVISHVTAPGGLRMRDWCWYLWCLCKHRWPKVRVGMMERVWQRRTSPSATSQRFIACIKLMLVPKEIGIRPLLIQRIMMLSNGIYRQMLRRMAITNDTLKSQPQALYIFAVHVWVVFLTVSIWQYVCHDPNEQKTLEQNNGGDIMPCHNQAGVCCLRGYVTVHDTRSLQAGVCWLRGDVSVNDTRSIQAGVCCLRGDVRVNYTRSIQAGVCCLRGDVTVNDTRSIHTGVCCLRGDVTVNDTRYIQAGACCLRGDVHIWSDFEY